MVICYICIANYHSAGLTTFSLKDKPEMRITIYGFLNPIVRGGKMQTELQVVMFTDQVKSTENTIRRMHAEVAQVSQDQKEITIEVLQLTRGTFLKDTGDGCLAQFQSVLEAVQAGKLIQKRTIERNSTLKNSRLRFDLHIGIDVGDVVVSADGDLRGEAVNRCSRICSQCPPGNVYISSSAASLLKQNEVELDLIGDISMKGIDSVTVLNVKSLFVWPGGMPNPFIWRGGITKAEDFYNRETEQRMLRSYLRGRQNCQIVGVRRIGKTSLLRQIERVSSDWDRTTVVVYVDLQDARCFTLSGGFYM